MSPKLLLCFMLMGVICLVSQSNGLVLVKKAIAAKGIALAGAKVKVNLAVAAKVAAVKAVKVKIAGATAAKIAAVKTVKAKVIGAVAIKAAAVKAAKLLAVGKIVAPIVAVKGALIAKKNLVVGKISKLTAQPHEQFIGLAKHNLVPNGLQLGANGLNFGSANIHNQGRGFLGNIGNTLTNAFKTHPAQEPEPVYQFIPDYGFSQYNHVKYAPHVNVDLPTAVHKTEVHIEKPHEEYGLN